MLATVVVAAPSPDAASLAVQVKPPVETKVPVIAPIVLVAAPVSVKIIV